MIGQPPADSISIMSAVPERGRPETSTKSKDRRVLGWADSGGTKLVMGSSRQMDQPGGGLCGIASTQFVSLFPACGQLPPATVSPLPDAVTPRFRAATA